MSAADDQNAAITTPERRNNSGILTADAGRPAGWVGGLLWLKSVAKRLSELLNEDGSSPPVVVKFAEDCMNAEGVVAELEPGQVILLENVRFYNEC